MADKEAMQEGLVNLREATEILARMLRCSRQRKCDGNSKCGGCRALEILERLTRDT